MKRNRALGYVMVIGPTIIALGAVAYVSYCLDGWTGMGIFVGAVLVGIGVIGTMLRGLDLLRRGR